MFVTNLKLAIHRVGAIAAFGAMLGVSTAASAGPVPATQNDVALMTLARADSPVPDHLAVTSTPAVALPGGLPDLAGLTLPASSWSPFGGSTIGADDHGTTPAPYAILGGLLIVAGLIARRFAAGTGQRGLSKKT